MSALDAPALTFEAFTAEVLAWVDWWNGEHEMDELEGATPSCPAATGAS